MAAELGEVEVGGGGDGLVGGDVAGQAAGGVRGVVGGADGEGVIEGGAPGRVGEGFLGLEAEGVAGDDPDDPVDEAGSDQAGGGDDGEEGFAAAGGDGGEDVLEVGFTGGDGGDDAGQLGLVGAEGFDRGLLGELAAARDGGFHPPYGVGLAAGGLLGPMAATRAVRSMGWEMAKVRRRGKVSLSWRGLVSPVRLMR